MSNLLKITVKTWWRSLRRGPLWLAPNAIKKATSQSKCPQPKKKLSDEKNKKKLIIKSSLIYTKPNRRNKSVSTIYMIKKKTNGKMVAHKVGKQERSWNHSIWVPKDVITNMKGPQMVWVPKETWSPRSASGDLEAWLTRRWRIQAKEAKLTSWTLVAQVPHKIIVARFQFNNHVAPLPLLGYLYCIT